MIETVLLLAGLVVGALAAWVFASRRGRAELEALQAARVRVELLQQQQQAAQRDMEILRQERRESESRREAAERREATLHAQLEAQQKETATILQAQEAFKHMFEAMGVKALDDSSRRFMEQAEKVLRTFVVEARGDVEKKQQAIDSLVKPIQQLLEKQNVTLGEIEKKRLEDKAGLEAQLRQIGESHQSLTRETAQLVKALRRPEQRGRWGEVQLRNCVELAGMLEHCDFQLQETLHAENGRLRPDMLVNLPGGGVVVVDSKVALDAYLDAAECADDGRRRECLLRHAAQLRDHVRSLADKKYWDAATSVGKRAPSVVIMFVPLESALSSAMDSDATLHADAMKDHVLIATPMLLVALLRAVAYGWQQEDVAKNARKIADAGRRLYECVEKFVEHYEKVGRNLRQATGAYNDSVGSLERNVLSAARRLKDLGAAAGSEMSEPPLIEVETRLITAPELKAGPGSAS